MTPLRYALSALLAALCLTAAAQNITYDQDLTLNKRLFDACLRSPQRQAQLHARDVSLVAEMVAKHGKTKLPRGKKAIVERLIAVSDLRGSSVQLVAYAAPFVNGHAGGKNLLALAGGSWKGPTALPENEFAALIAHELAHLEQRDSLRIACASVAFRGDPDLPLETIVQDVIAESFSGNPPLARAMSALNFEAEFAADRRATELLSAAGYCSSGMQLLLERLMPKTSEGFSLKTHPQQQARIDALKASGACGLTRSAIQLKLPRAPESTEPSILP